MIFDFAGNRTQSCGCGLFVRGVPYRGVYLSIYLYVRESLLSVPLLSCHSALLLKCILRTCVGVRNIHVSFVRGVWWLVRGQSRWFHCTNKSDNKQIAYSEVGPTIPPFFCLYHPLGSRLPRETDPFFSKASVLLVVVNHPREDWTKKLYHPLV